MPFFAIVILLVITTGLVMGFVEIDLLIGYIPGAVLGIMTALAIVRKLGKKAQKSLIASSLFFKLTRYRATVYNITKEAPQTVSAVVYGEANDYADLMDVLKKQWRFPANTAKDAAQYAMKIAKGKPLQEKVREALQFIDGGDNHKNVATEG